MGPMESVLIALLALAISVCFCAPQAGGGLVLSDRYKLRRSADVANGTHVHFCTYKTANNNLLV